MRAEIWRSLLLAFIILDLQDILLLRLQTLWEQKNRVLLEEYYIFNVAIPLEGE